ncbi:MAG: hypothetical protein LC104_00535 [Bacteroidales bacterium]|nr:hypothetical protein [Bacteroidales bacterium]MCZ2340264.1 hypothetical protein [Bacteroidales bacterium]
MRSTFALLACLSALLVTTAAIAGTNRFQPAPVACCADCGPDTCAPGCCAGCCPACAE